MDAIKKKMQAMKLEKDNAMDRADACEQQAKDANLRAERVMLPIHIFPKELRTPIISNYSSASRCFNEYSLLIQP